MFRNIQSLTKITISESQFWNNAKLLMKFSLLDGMGSFLRSGNIH